jgi:hypothetical protein
VRPESDLLPVDFFFRPTTEDPVERDIPINVDVEEKRRERDDV